jgi:hypothetical protein
LPLVSGSILSNNYLITLWLLEVGIISYQFIKTMYLLIKLNAVEVSFVVSLLINTFILDLNMRS